VSVQFVSVQLGRSVRAYRFTCWTL